VNPKFIEDIVRDISSDIARLYPSAEHSVSAENFESIHNHSAYAEVVSEGFEPMRQAPAPGPPRRSWSLGGCPIFCPRGFPAAICSAQCGPSARELGLPNQRPAMQSLPDPAMQGRCAIGSRADQGRCPCRIGDSGIRNLTQAGQ